MSCRTSVIIPFYQREKGILARALRSVLEQVDVPPPDVIVVDDGSPVPARSELEDLPAIERGAIRVIEQENQGPGAARNTGLENVPESVEYVAFLDSDDRWLPVHLATALRALDEGYDFFCGDFVPVGATESAFSRQGLLDRWPHEPLPAVSEVFRVTGSFFFCLFVTPLVGTSTVVYRYRKLRSVRFREDLLRSAEDAIFWLELAHKTDLAAFTTRCGVEYGRGVNINQSVTFGSPDAPAVIYDDLKARRILETVFELEPELKRANRRKIRAFRKDFAFDLLHRLRNGKPIDWRWFRKHVALDPLSLAGMPATAMRVMWDRHLKPAKGRSEP